MSEGNNLLSKSMGAAAWAYGGNIVKLLSQVLAQIVLARVIGPADYGVFAIGVLVISFSILLSDAAAGPAIVQAEELTSELIRFALTSQLLVGGLVTGGLWITADWIALFFHEPKAVWVIRALSLVCLLNALSSISLNLLKRHLDFKTIQIAQVTGHAAGYLIVGIPLAMYGLGVWSMVAAWMVQSALSWGIMYRTARHPWLPKFSAAGGRQLSHFGLFATLTNFANWIIANADRIVVGKVFNLTQVGLYTTPYNFLTAPISQLLGSLQSVLFPASARMNGNQQQSRTAFMALLSAVSLIVFPVLWAIAVIPETVLYCIYGPKWLASADILQAFAFGLPFYCIMGVGTPILWGQGSVQKEFLVQIVIAIVVVAGAIYISAFGTKWIAWFMALIFVLRACWILYIVARLLGLAIKTIVLALAVAMGIAGFCAAVVFWTDVYIASVWPSLIARIVVLAVGWGVCWMTGVMMLRGSINPNLTTIVTKFIAKRFCGKVVTRC